MFGFEKGILYFFVNQFVKNNFSFYYCKLRYVIRVEKIMALEFNHFWATAIKG